MVLNIHSDFTFNRSSDFINFLKYMSISEEKNYIKHKNLLGLAYFEGQRYKFDTDDREKHEELFKSVSQKFKPTDFKDYCAVEINANDIKNSKEFQEVIDFIINAASDIEKTKMNGVEKLFLVTHFTQIKKPTPHLHIVYKGKNIDGLQTALKFYFQSYKPEIQLNKIKKVKK